MPDLLGEDQWLNKSLRGFLMHRSRVLLLDAKWWPLGYLGRIRH